jgi:hypothetical protein
MTMMMMIDNKNHYRNDDIDDNIDIKLDHNTSSIITSYNINNSNNNDTIIIPNSFLTYFFNFDSLLPQGRLNGFQNMLTLINKQLINLLSSPTTTTATTTTTTANTTANTNSSNEQTVVTLQIPSVTLTVISNSNTTTSITITTTTSSSNGTLNNNSTISNNDNHHHHDNINHLSTIQIEQLASRAEELSSEVAVLLSGGVDSSVALKLLIDEGMYVLMVIIIIMMKDI